MNRLRRPKIFTETAKEFFPSIDETNFEYDLRQLGIDDMGPTCSDSALMELFKNHITESISDNDLYSTIEKVCLRYVQKIYEE